MFQPISPRVFLRGHKAGEKARGLPKSYDPRKALAGHLPVGRIHRSTADSYLADLFAGLHISPKPRPWYSA